MTHAPILSDKERKPFHLSISEIMFADAQRDWPKGGGWYVLRAGEYLGPFETEENAESAP